MLRFLLMATVMNMLAGPFSAQGAGASEDDFRSLNVFFTQGGVDKLCSAIEGKLKTNPADLNSLWGGIWEDAREGVFQDTTVSRLQTIKSAIQSQELIKVDYDKDGKVDGAMGLLPALKKVWDYYSMFGIDEGAKTAAFNAKCKDLIDKSRTEIMFKFAVDPNQIPANTNEFEKTRTLCKAIVWAFHQGYNNLRHGIQEGINLKTKDGLVKDFIIKNEDGHTNGITTKGFFGDDLFEDGVEQGPCDKGSVEFVIKGIKLKVANDFEKYWNMGEGYPKEAETETASTAINQWFSLANGWLGGDGKQRLMAKVAQDAQIENSFDNKNNAYAVLAEHLTKYEAREIGEEDAKKTYITKGGGVARELCQSIDKKEETSKDLFFYQMAKEILSGDGLTRVSSARGLRAVGSSETVSLRGDQGGGVESLASELGKLGETPGDMGVAKLGRSGTSRSLGSTG